MKSGDGNLKKFNEKFAEFAASDDGKNLKRELESESQRYFSLEEVDTYISDPQVRLEVIEHYCKAVEIAAHSLEIQGASMLIVLKWGNSAETENQVISTPDAARILKKYSSLSLDPLSLLKLQEVEFKESLLREAISFSNSHDSQARACSDDIFPGVKSAQADIRKCLMQALEEYCIRYQIRHYKSFPWNRFRSGELHLQGWPDRIAMVNISLLKQEDLEIIWVIRDRLVVERGSGKQNTIS